MRALAGIAVAACCALAAPAQAAIVDDAPAAAGRGPGQVEVFVRGAGTTLLRSARTPAGTWTPWQTLDGAISSGPGAFGQTAGRTDLFMRGLNDRLYHRIELGAAWGGWESLGGSLLSAPTASLRKGLGWIDVYVRWADNTIRHNTWIPSSGWYGWQLVPGGGLTTAAPAEISRGSRLIDVFIRGVNDHVYQIDWNGSAYSSWTYVGGTTTDAPAVVSRVTNTTDLFFRGTDGQIYWRTFDGAHWTDSRLLPGVVDSGPAATTDSAGNIYLFARAGGDVSVDVYNGTAWSGWQPIHPAPPPPPPPPPPPACTPAAGSVSATARTVRFGRRPRLTGRVRAAGGAPLAGASVQVTRLSGAAVASAVTRSDGRFAVRLRRGHDRSVRVIVSVPALRALACSSPIALRVRAGVRLRASRAVVPGGRIHFSGRLLGGPIPPHGKLIELQAFDGGRWRTFATPRARRGHHGRFHVTYHLQQTFGPRTFRFRARVRREAAYPYVEGYSKSVRVRVL